MDGKQHILHYGSPSRLHVVETYGTGGRDVLKSYSLNDRKSITIHGLSNTSGALQILAQMFLPAGYPATVTPDYLRYMFDSLQAFTGEIAGLLASRAVLTSLGVGSSSPGATATAAVLLNIIQDTCGRLATILGAWKLGPVIEPECKTWRIAADIFNDVGIVLECLSPALPHRLKVLTLCFARTSRALCGVAAGGAKAALSRHFVSAGGSIADVNAKESSQETVVALCGMLVGSILVPRITSAQGTWAALVLLIGVHLLLNFLGVRSVTMSSLNRQRATLVLGSIIDRRPIPSPSEAARMESIFAPGSRLFLPSDSNSNPKAILGRCRIGVSLEEVIKHLRRHGDEDVGATVENLLRQYDAERYVLLCTRSRWGRADVLVCLKPSATPRDTLYAWTHALLAARARGRQSEGHAALQARELLNEHWEALERVGWRVDESCLLTGSDRRIEVVSTGDARYGEK
ncbi:DUF647-domain-containing protein [Exidia glandulosa HHB12029]|uniref:DUF647-domain-containing protein n=1 Tax=Exidia glandulosa HHB12029 TaxID=1314781 RepID=A0A165NUW0_EXIGL|nr:DUF647-domain-containing protein [Exidia glandulosa HHB12029]